MQLYFADHHLTIRDSLNDISGNFMFELTKTEKHELVANCDRLSSLKHSSVNTLAFTEQGVSMLSSVIRSENIIKLNIEIMRTFARYRALLNENKELNQENLLDIN
ncbi:MAG: ORF6N domain-containing protein [Bacteroidota bacterium]|nr:ORF6N domain-containing protein [Bacteroidota bacterium]